MSKGNIRCDGCGKFTPLNSRHCAHCGKDQFAASVSATTEEPNTEANT